MSTIPSLLLRNAHDFPDSPALSSAYTDDARTLTWSELHAASTALARGLRSMGLSRDDRLLIAIPKRPEHWITDLAAAHLGVISCSTYDSISEEDIRHVLRHSRARAVVLESQEQAEMWLPILREQPNPPTVIVVEALSDVADPYVRFDDILAGAPETDSGGIDPEDIASLIRPDDPLCMIYTSGTTGPPKGVVLSHRNVLHTCEALHRSTAVPDHPRSVSYLPLAHIAERLFGIYLPLWECGHAVICRTPTDLDAALVAVRPETMGGVPRTWEKLATRLRTLASGLPADTRAAVETAQSVVLEAHRARAERTHIDDEIISEAARLDEAILRPLRAELGLDRLARATVGAAPIAEQVLDELASYGLPLLELYGLSETAGVVTLSRPDRFRTGTVGSAIAGTDVQIAQDGEVTVRGPSVFLGYLTTDGTIASGTDLDGLYRTGDLGEVDDKGFLRVTGRKKELIITSGGKNISPLKIESKLLRHPLVGYAMVVGDRRKYLTAVLVLDNDFATTWARDHDDADTTGPLDGLARHPEVRKELDLLVSKVNSELSRVEQIKRYLISDLSWTSQTGELTPTSKIRRSHILEKYSVDIERMYL